MFFFYKIQFNCVVLMVLMSNCVSDGQVECHEQEQMLKRFRCILEVWTTATNTKSKQERCQICSCSARLFVHSKLFFRIKYSEREVRVGNKFKIGLILRYEEVKFPQNYEMVLKRKYLITLKKYIYIDFVKTNQYIWR